MRVQVRYFAAAREATGLETEVLDLDEGASVGDAWTTLAGRHPDLAALRSQLRFAVGAEFTAEEAPLADGQTLALIPPVGGG